MKLPEGLRFDNYGPVKEILVEFIKDYVKKTGVYGVVLGLSGGVDSSLVAALACEAIGANRVLGILLPVDAEKDAKNVEDAQMLARDLGMQHELFELKHAIKAFDALELEKVALGNLTARLRMVTWYAKANQENRLVLGTGNKTELMIGYFTKYGDGGTDILPIGDLYKSNVWDLSRHLGLPEKIVKKIPTAGLWEGQTDEGEIGITYPELDTILFLNLEMRMNEQQIIDWGISESKVRKVLRMMEHSKHKREPLPKPILR
ncbi:NAD+ synthase [Candidatus Thorarchaeota archaeon]|nr:MAG: NAD+ synthase [Candidatus Thorarchaeota archaeon]